MDLDGHIIGIRSLYRHKCELMIKGLEQHLPPFVEFTRPEGGLFIWCTLPEGIDSAPFVKQALERKVAVVPGSTFNCDPATPSRSFRLNYSTPTDAEIVEGVARLGEAAKTLIT